MAFCASCGNDVGGAAFCPKCGAAQAATPGAASATATPAAAPAAGMTTNVAAALSYVLAPLGGILFLVLEPHNKDRFVRFHAFQSIFFGLAAIVLRYALAMVFASLIFSGGFSFFWMLLWVVQLGLIGCWCLLFFKAYNKEEFKLPIIGDLAAKQAGA